MRQESQQILLLSQRKSHFEQSTKMIKKLGKQQIQNIRPISVASKDKRRASSGRKTDFDGYFQDLVIRKNNPFTVLQSPHLMQKTNDITAVFNDQYISAMSTPPTRVLRHLQRKKYVEIKERICQAVAEIQKNEFTSMKDLFQYRQTILSQFLNEFAEEIQKQCKEKGEILKYIWNSMFNMLDHISQKLGQNLLKSQKTEVKNSLKSHKIYQQMIDKYHQKQITLNQKSKLQRTTINSLVYELRFKRKQINKLYRNQKMLVNKLNQFKSDNVNLQSSYIDLMSSLRDMPPENVQLLLKARQQIHKSKQTKLNIRGNKKHNKIDIAKQLKAQEQGEDLDQLYEELKEIATCELHSPHLINTLIEAAIQNYGIKNDDHKVGEQAIVAVAQKMPTMNAETQINEFQFKYPGRIDEITQFSFYQKLNCEIINSKTTQTYCEFNRKKVLIDRQTDVDLIYMRHRMVESRFSICSTVDQLLNFRDYQEPAIKINQINFQKSHKKHFSELNVSDHQFSINFKDSESKASKEKKNRDSESDADLLSSKKIQKQSKFAKIKKRTQKVSNTNFFPKGRYGSMISDIQKVSKIQKQEDANISSGSNGNSALYKKSSFAPKEKEEKKQSKLMRTQPISTPVSRSQSRKNDSLLSSSVSMNKIAKEQVHKNSFLQKNNYFNIQINEQKQNYINTIFVKKGYPTFYMDLDGADEQDQDKMQESDEEKQSQNDIPDNTSKFILALPKRQMKRSSTSSIARSEKRASAQLYNDENDLLLNMCRNNYNKKRSKKIKERVSIFKYRDEFTSVKDNIQIVAKDVRYLIVHKESILKKAINSKNLKNTYKILMMTFSKAYDCYNKGIIISNLVYPLFQSFALVYGAINNTQIYKKMINFIACLAVNTDNNILRFFIFFLGLDDRSPYSQKVTISQVYLCLKLLQKISVDGKVTLNIESIYTDTTKIKEQLIYILKQEKIPEQLSLNVEKRVVEQLQNSCLYRNSSKQDTHLKINIYNIILLIIQEVIKCKNNLRDSFVPILQFYDEFEENKKMPIHLLQIVLSMWKSNNFDANKLQILVQTLKKSSKTETITIQQFCSILFQCNLIDLDQLYSRSRISFKKGWRIPNQYIQSLRTKSKTQNYASPLQKHEVTLFLKLTDSEGKQSSQYCILIQKMKRLLFEKHYQSKADDLISNMMGPNLIFWDKLI